MDKLTKQLKDDAAAIDASVDEALRRRLDASLEAARPVPSRAAPRTRRHWLRLGALATIAAASAATVLMTTRTPQGPEPLTATPPVTVAAERPLPLNIQPAQLTDPLSDEMKNLETDWRKVRARVESDLGFRL